MIIGYGNEVKNYMEDVVYVVLRDILKGMNICKCDKCVADIAAVALNSLPCKYYVTTRGGVYFKVDTLRQQYDVDVIAALTKAIEIVSKAPRHETP